MSAAIAASAAAIAASSAANAARSAQKAECTLIINGFDAKAATIKEAQGYATCVQMIYPVDNDMAYEQVLSMKVAIVFIIVCTIIGCFKMGREERCATGYGLGILLGATTGLGICASIGLLVLGIDFLFTA